MSYVVFALKWRPKDFNEIIGQDRVVETLKNALQKNRLAHAYLFAGPRGVGKTSTARILAKALNCKEGPTISPCGTCSSCLGIARGQSLDVIEIDGASNRGIDEIRTLRENVKFSPAQGKFKVYIIDEVHQITQEGFNALLKTLEEPPPYVKFIFATTHPHKVLPTILSRCQRLDFRRVSNMEIIAQLEKIVSAEKIQIDKNVLFAIAKASDGSLRDAESILDQLFAFSKGRVSLEDVTSMLGMVEQDVLFTITEKIIKKDVQGVLSLLSGIIDGGKDPAIFLANLIEHFRNLMVAKVAQEDSGLIDLPQEICTRLRVQAQEISLEEIFQAFNALLNGQEMSKRFDSVRIPLEICLARLAHNKKEQVVYSTANAPDRPSPTTSKPQQSASVYKPPEPPAPRPPVQKQPPQAQAPVREDCNEPPQEPFQAKAMPSISMDMIKEEWGKLISGLSGIKMSVATYLNEGSPVQVQGNVVTVGFPKNCSLHKEALETKENRLLIEKNFSELMNSGMRINFILSKEEAQEKKETTQDTFVRSALDLFKGRIVKED